MTVPAQLPPSSRFTVCVFCGSSPGHNPQFLTAAQELGRQIGQARWSLVFGGGNVGLMGATARAVRAAGQPVHGVLPDFLQQREPPMTHGETVELLPDLQTRKRRMLTLAQAFVLLPGGFGTLDEFFEVLTEAQLQVHSKPVILVDIAGYYAPLLALLEHVVRHGFARAESLDLCQRVTDVAEAMTALQRAAGTIAQAD